MISSLRGRCPKPLDECAVNYSSGNYIKKSSQSSQISFTEELFNKFLEARPTGISKKTVEAYHYTLRKFIGYSITAENITLYLNSLTCENGKLKFYSCLRALCNWLFEYGYINENPIRKVHALKTVQRLLPAISGEQREILLNLCHCIGDKALIGLLWYSGMRVSEIARIKATDFNWQDGTVVVMLIHSGGVSVCIM